MFEVPRHRATAAECGRYQRMLELSPPFNWCDRRCERCPLRETCPIPAREPDLPDVPEEAMRVALAHLTECLTEALEIATSEAIRRGLDVDNLPPVPPPDIETLLIEQAALRLVAAAGPRDQAAALLVAIKLHRVAGGGEVDDELFELDSAPNLLLVERSLDELAHLPAAAPLRALVAPLLARISDETRVVLATLARGGRAPSPWSVTETVPGAPRG